MISYIQEQKPKIPIHFLCMHFGVSRSGLYEWQKTSQPPRLVKKSHVCEAISKVFRDSYGTYGSPRIYHELKAQGFIISENTIAKYMQELGLDARLKKKFRVQTTDSKHSLPIADRLIRVEDENTLPNAPGEILAGDITYLRLGSGFVYLAVVLDLYTREVVGWSMQKSLHTKLVLDALGTAIAKVAA